MRVDYDREVDAVYIQLGDRQPDDVIEMSDGVHMDTTADNQIVGIEILDASKKLDIQTILSYEIDLGYDPMKISVPCGLG